MRTIWRGSLVLGAVLCAAAPAFAAPARPRGGDAVLSLRVLPSSLVFSGRRDTRRVVVLGVRKDGSTIDLTDRAVYRPQGGLATSAGSGYLAPAKVGRGSVRISAAGRAASLPITVRSMAAPPVSFVRDIEPVLARTGCNSGTCHGAQAGRNGFKLSLRGYDPDFDYNALVDDVSGRRFNRAAPDRSLMLEKPTQQVAHQGGLVFRKDNRYYALIRQWIAEGVRSDISTTTRVSRLEVLPKNPTLPLPGMKQNLVVIAHYPDGTTRDVTRDARFSSSTQEVAGVSEAGLVTAIRRGESAVLVSYEGQFGVNEFTVLGDRTGWKWAGQPQRNFIDRRVDAKLKRLKSAPAPLCSDSDFLRRAYLDLTGLPPTPAAARAYQADTRPSDVKRAELVERLLQSPEFDDHWTYKLADLLQVNSKFMGPKGVQAFRAWIHTAVRQNRPYDQFVREVLTAQGPAYENPPANYLRVIRDSSTAAENVTQLFLGVRYSCNRCHDHPFERWTQSQYYEMAAFFARVGFKGGQPGEEVVYERPDGEVTHPRTGRVMPPAFPFVLQGGEKAEEGSRREMLADWLTSPQNPFFARSMANRVWSYFLGRGIIDPVDDIRASNPPVNAPLLDELTADFVKSGFDLRHLMRTIVSSRVYQSSISTNRWNADDRTNFSHQTARRLTAEQLLDAISQATGSIQKYPGVPYGTRAQQLHDTRVAGNFLDLFGRPARESPCECERSSEVSLAQALNLMNGATVSEALQDPNGRVPRLVKEHSDNGRLVEEIYLAVFSRLPTRSEVNTASRYIQASKDRLEGAQDVMWALLNSPAFLFNR